MRTLNDNLKRGAWWRVMLAVLLLAPAAHAAEIHSNGRGGGAWSDPQTWHGHQVPEAADTVVIAMRDTVTFDRDDRAQPSCAALYLDPEAVLTFERGDHQRTLTVAGPVESYGTIRLDGTRNRGGRFALRLVGEGAEQRTIHLRENAALLLYGHEAHPNGERTVHLAADTLDPEAEAEAEMGRIAADGDAMIDLHHSRIQDFELALANLDNTGAESNERLNVIGNHLVGVTALKLHACDTPTIRDNHFQADGDVRRVMAIELRGVSLPEIRGNTIEGAYNVGIYTWGGTSETIQDNDIIGCNTGIRLHSTDPSVKNVRISATDHGVYLYHGNPVLEKVVVRDAALSYLLHESNAQFTDCSAPAPPPAEDEQEPADDADEGEDDGEDAESEPRRVLRLEQSTVRLINSPIEPDQVEHEGKTRDGEPYVQTMQYVVARVRAGDSGRLPADLRVAVRTAEQSGGVPEGQADLNVRNSPVPVSQRGLTPLPESQHALTVRGWRIEANGKLRQAPFYDLIVSAPTEGQNGEQAHETLTQTLIEPSADWFRPEPNRPEPTVEVTLP